MTKHKAPTQVTIASIQEETFLHLFVERYWKTGVGLAILVAAGILVPTYLRGQAVKTHHGAWDDLQTQADLGTSLRRGVQSSSPEALAIFAEQHKSDPVGAWAKALEIGARVDTGEVDQAEKAASLLGTLWPGHLLATQPLIPQPDGARTLPATIIAGKASLHAWEKEHAFLFSNPDLPSDAPRVRITTSKGAVLLGLYSDRAPQHVENFLKLCREGYYTGTKFHRVVRGSLIQGGDPNSISGAPESWGAGGPDTTLEQEIDPQLRHFKGALSAWKVQGETRSHGSQFVITTADQNQMDGQYTVFGRVLEGDSVLEAIESGAVVGDRPQDPAVISAVEVL